MKNLYSSFVLVVSLLVIACNNTNNINSKNIDNSNNQKLLFAKGFEITQYPNYKVLRVFSDYKGDTTPSTYYLVPKNKEVPQLIKNKHIIRTPISSIVVSSTTHIPMIELLGMEKTIVGFPNTKYISSKKTRALIESGAIIDLGQNQQMNTELLVDLQPEVVVGFGVTNTAKIFTTIKKMGIPVIYNSDWLEETPLGRAEWIRFFGALYNLDSLALDQFKSIANRYQKLKKIVKNTNSRPNILSGALFQDVWHLPAGDSFVAQFITDAGADYLWKETKGTGSLSLSLESVLEKGEKADYWVAPGYYNSKKEMLNDSPHYAEFRSFSKGNLYTFSNTKGPTGGVIYYELATTRPDLVLEDLISIFHPDILPKHQKYFFSKLE